MRYYFEWDINKAKTNFQKHKISFEDAAGIFLDPLTVTVFDKEHSECEDRWATIGTSQNGVLLVIVHTFQQIDSNFAKIRIISARKATRKEIRQYKEVNR